MVRFILPSLLAALVAALPATAAEPSAEQKLVADVNKAIEKGVQYLRVNRDAKEQWEGFTLGFLGMKGGGTALATLALLNCGLKADDKDVAGALAYLRGITPERTYTVALTTMAFAEARDPQDLPRIQKNVDWLIKTATRQDSKLTGWSYPQNATERPDGSNTQYALLGLYAGKQAGAKIPDALWKEIRDLYVRTQVADKTTDTGSWKYIEAAVGGGGGSFTMTTAGVSGLVIANMGLDANEHQLNPVTGVSANCGVSESNDPIRRGLNWIGKNFAFESAIESKSAFYNTYGIERVGRLSGQRFLGRADWYREGCEWLVKVQHRDGYWSRAEGVGIDGIRVVSTSFSLLFLSKGRSPVLISKLAYGDFVEPQKGVIIEKGGEKGVIGWNRKHNDARHLTEFVARELFKGMPLGWQVYDPRRVSLPNEQALLEEVGVLVQSPILYLTGHDAPKLTGQQKELLKKYIEEGGFVVAEACCGSKDFADGFRKLAAELFPDNELKPLPPEHAIWRAHFAVPPADFKKLEGMNRGCRTVMVFSPEPLAGFWEESKYMPKPAARVALNRGEQAFRLGANVIAYATGMEPPKQRLTSRRIESDAKDLKAPPKGFIQPAQIKLESEAPPAPAAMRNLMGYVRDVAQLDVVTSAEQIFPANDDLTKYKFMYMHGRKAFDWEKAERDHVKINLQMGGMLLADACCGSEKFDASFRAMIEAMFADEKLKLEPIPVDDKLYSEKINGGVAIKTVMRREKVAAAAAGNDGGYEQLPPKLEGIKLDGRWVVIYSQYDIGCALENHKSTDCLGHNPESAKRLAAAAVLYSLKRGN